MPIREFTCQSCGHKKEVVFLNRENELKTIACEKCGGESVRIISVTSRPQFSGSGFYETDYKDK